MRKVVSGQWSVVSGRKAVGVLLMVVWALLLLALAACGGEVDTSQPPEIIYGQDVCNECNMIISEEKHAAAFWTAEGEARRFDDVGEMLVYMSDNPDVQIATTWVHDINSVEWLAAEEAWFVMNSGVTTPMGTGIVALSSEEEARALAFDQEMAVVMTFDEIVAAANAGELMNAHGMGD